MDDDGDDGDDLHRSTARRLEEKKRQGKGTLETHPKLCAAQLGELHLRRTNWVSESRF